MIKIEKITKKFNETVLNNVNYKFHKGKIYVIKGVSGCGKTTFLNILSGLDRNYEGTCYYKGISVKSMTNKEFNSFRNKVGYIFQNSLLISNLTIKQNLVFIKKKETRIQYYADKFNVTHLLDKYPDQLSKGERQKISIIRSLLYEPGLIIADEPTASLDSANSLVIADEFKKISTTDNIIIISTHKDCFDKVADEIIYLDYGAIIETVKCKNCILRSNGDKNDTEDPIPIKTDTVSINSEQSNLAETICFILEKNKNKYKFKKLLPVSFIILLLLILIAIKTNFTTEYAKIIKETYPMELVIMDKGAYNDLKQEADLTIYKNYTLSSKNDEVRSFPLFPKKISCLNIKGTIEIGDFPSSKKEVIISKGYAKDIFHTADYKECIGKSLTYKGYKFTVTGIVSDNPAQMKYLSNNNYYDVNAEKTIYIPYTFIEYAGLLLDSDLYMVKCKGLYDSSKMFYLIKKYMETGQYVILMPWAREIEETQAIIDIIFLIIMLILIVLSVIILAFIFNEISLELYYRRKEFGYLQIFNLSKKKIKFIIILEYMIKYIFCVIIAIFLFILTSIITKIAFSVNIMISPLILFTVAIGLILYSILIAFIPANKFLKINIIDLIH